MSKCARPGCDKAGIHKCSICLRELYCSGECQKEDWKSHKLICKSLKKLSHERPYNEALTIIKEMINESQKKMNLDIRFLNHLISYAGHQFGDRIPGKAYRERYNGERINNWNVNWNVEIGILIPLYSKLNYSYNNDESLSSIDIDNLSFSNLEKMLDLLRPWSVDHNLDTTDQISNQDKEQIECLLVALSETECRIACIYTERSQFDQAENHCQRALSYAKLYKGKDEKKTDLLCTSLRVYIHLRQSQGKHANAVIYAEEFYNLVAVAYNPVHPKVQEAAGTLIECLIFTDDLYNAERFAQATLDSLKDPGNGLDQESDAVAYGYYNLAKVIHQQKGDFVRAEMLVRESLRITSQLYCHDHRHVGFNIDLLANISQSQGKLDNETKELYERSLAICKKQYGPDGNGTAAANISMAGFYHKLADIQETAETRIDHLRLSLSHYKEALRIYTKTFGPNGPRTIQVSSTVLNISGMLEKG